eukprot:TRINITY_DN12199_c0_g3_i1.p1 TRINITY_DN12199_c0_g3~~TRINITY_DN12199_c0_g3_i1.p1  ORF type:complete len:280 (-),score=30.56 TRINITY_DN12199_c0_g3_i1:260-1099(-)
MPEQPARKRPAENAGSEVHLPDEPPIAWMTAFRNMFSEELKPVTQRVEAIENVTNTMQVNMSNLADRVTRLEQAHASSTTGSTTNTSSVASRNELATRIELKGWCSWNDRASKGLDRVTAIQLVNRLRAALPVECQNAVSDPVLFGSRSASILVPVTSDYIREAVGYWKELMASDTYQNEYPGCFARLEVSAERKAANSLLARALRFTEHHLKAPAHDVRPFWAPDYTIYSTNMTSKQSYEICHLDSSLKKLIWTKDALTVFKTPTLTDLELAFRKHKS